MSPTMPVTLILSHTSPDRPGEHASILRADLAQTCSVSLAVQTAVSPPSRSCEGDTDIMYYVVRPLLPVW